MIQVPMDGLMRAVFMTFRGECPETIKFPQLIIQIDNYLCYRNSIFNMTVVGAFSLYKSEKKFHET